jgi:metal-dependent amidase/aminoacylase/carboxypeptidase family protein
LTQSSLILQADRRTSPSFANEVPGLFFYLGIVPRDQDLTKAAPNHSPNFFVDETALVVGVRALAMVTVNYLAEAKID